MSENRDWDKTGVQLEREIEIQGFFIKYAFLWVILLKYINMSERLSHIIRDI